MSCSSSSSFVIGVVLCGALLQLAAGAARLTTSFNDDVATCNYFPGRNYTSDAIIKTVKDVPTSYGCCQQCTDEPMCEAATFNENTYECVLVSNKSSFVNNVHGLTGIANEQTPAPTPQPTPAPTPHPTPRVGFAAIVCAAAQDCAGFSLFPYGTSAEEAKEVALAMMNKSSAVVLGVTTAQEPCVALATGIDKMGWAVASTAKGAEHKAMKNCNSGFCALEVSGCAEHPPANAHWGAFGFWNSGVEIKYEVSGNSSVFSSPSDAVASVLNAWKSKHSSALSVSQVFFDCMAAAMDGTNTDCYAAQGTTLSAAEAAAMKTCRAKSVTGTCYVGVSACAQK